MKPIDRAMEKVTQYLFDKAVKEKKMKPLLDEQLKKIEKLDKNVLWHEEKIKGIEEEKQIELRKMNDLLELAETSSHELRNGFKVLPDNKYYIQIKDVSEFMKWLKENKSPEEVFNFFKTSLKKTGLKDFCQKEINQQRLDGEISPIIGGIDFGDITYRRLTTKRREKK